MSERERWVVYPLLFLALGAGLRDKLGGRLTTKSIVCQELRIEEEPVGNQPPRPLAVIGRTEATQNAPAVGYLFVNGEAEVDGDLNVTRAVTAKQYKGVSMIQALPPGVSVRDLMRALQAAPTVRQPGGQKDQPKRESKSAPAKSNSDGARQPKD